MKIGIVVYSQTGNTLLVAQKLQEELEASGLAASIEQVTIIGSASPGSKDVQLDNTPQVDPYDAIVFGSPVQAFSLASAMKAYLKQLPSLKGKKIACFVTKQLPFHWTGGTRAVGTMKQICQARGASVIGSDIVVWSKTRRDENINQCVIHLASLVNKSVAN